MSHWWWQERHLAKIVPVCQSVKVLPWYLGTLVGTSEPWNKGDNDVKFGHLEVFAVLKQVNPAF